jgi:hypothetical protein
MEIIGVDTTETLTPPFEYQFLQVVHGFSRCDGHRKTALVPKKKTRDSIARHAQGV